MNNLVINKLAFLNFLFLLLLLACSEKNTKILHKQYNNTILEAYKTTTRYSEAGVVSMQMLADQIQQYKNGDKIYPHGFYMEFYESDGSISSIFKANYVHYYADKELYKAEGNVEIKNLKKQEQLNTEELYWELGKKKIFTEKFVSIKTDDEVLTGKGFTADQDFTYYKILAPTGVLGLEKLE